ncbi:MAG TPA: signal peptidase I [Acidimicrobiales bacterium]|nr:signal peptidase I [Acidimicrobiales bacterium]
MSPPAASGGDGGGGGFWRSARELPLLVACAALLAFLLKSFVAQAFYIPSGSMLPQLHINDRVVVSKLAYRLHAPRRGDIVVFDCPKVSCPSGPPKDDGGGLRKAARKVAEGVGVVQPSTEEFIKRVIGLPGETVEGRNGSVYVDGRRLKEPYLPKGTVTTDFAPITVPAGHLWVMGDNRGNSSDSRVFGPIPRSTVVGRTVVKLWPAGDASFL